MSVNNIDLIPWPFKVVMLLSGIKYHLLGLLLVILDGRFHFISSIDELKEQSPDWIISRNVFGVDALSERNHKIMGVLLLSGAITSLILLFSGKEKTKIVQFYLKVVQPMTLIIIAIAIILKNLVLSSESKNVAFL